MPWMVVDNLKYLLCALHLPFDCNYAFHLKTVYFSALRAGHQGAERRKVFRFCFPFCSARWRSFHPICDCLRCSSLNTKPKLNSNTTGGSERLFLATKSSLDCSRGATSCFRIHDKQIFVAAVFGSLSTAGVICLAFRVRSSLKGKSDDYVTRSKGILLGLSQHVKLCLLAY